MRLFLLLLLVAAVGLPLEARSQGVSKVGTTAGQFLKIRVGPRAVAMGSATVAGVNDASALYWNPGGLANIEGHEAAGTHINYLTGISFDHLGAAVRAMGGHVGVSVTMLSVPDDVVRTYDMQQGTGETFDAASMALGLTYGRAITDRFSVGATVKYIQERIWNSSARGMAFDLGIQFRTDFWGGLTLGAALYNFGSDMKMDGRDILTQVDPDPRQMGNNDRIPAVYRLDAWGLPTDFQFGIKLTPVDTRLQRLAVHIDALHPASNHESVNIGMEYALRDRFFLRGGYEGLFLEGFESGPSGGIGIHQPLPSARRTMAKLEYAYQSKGRLGGLHVVGFGVTF